MWPQDLINELACHPLEKRPRLAVVDVERHSRVNGLAQSLHTLYLRDHIAVLNEWST